MAQWLITVPNGPRNTTATILENWKLKVQRPGLARVSGFDVPNLVVGTLDSLMSLSDDLRKTNLLVENVVRKVEKQYVDVGGLTPHDGQPGEQLRVDGVMPADFIRSFQWDFARFQRKPLPELVTTMQQTVGRVEEELRRMSTAYSEKLQVLSLLNRRRAAKLSGELEDVLEPHMIREGLQQGIIVPPSSEYLATLILVLPTASEGDFLATYATLGADIAAYGGPDYRRAMETVGRLDANFGANSSRGQRRGSPVVPGSAHVLLREGDQTMFAVTILRGQYEAGRMEGSVFQAGTYVDYVSRFKEVCREKRILARDLYNFDPKNCGKLTSLIAAAVADLETATSTIVRWCRAHYGEVFSAWIHLKVVHVFVESVLRYGLPVNFTAAFVEPVESKEPGVTAAMGEALGIVHEAAAEGEEDEEGDDAALVVGHGAVPYVWMKFGLAVKKE